MLANVLRQPLRQIFQEIRLQRESQENKTKNMEEEYKALEEQGEIVQKLEASPHIRGTAGGFSLQNMTRM